MLSAYQCCVLGVAVVKFASKLLHLIVNDPELKCMKGGDFLSSVVALRKKRSGKEIEIKETR